MSKHIKIRKGVNIKLVGEAEKVLVNAESPEIFTIKPSDFHGLTPKMLVKEGAEVKAGTILFFDKHREKIKYTSPVSGEIVEINRGEKRRILGVKILADKEIRYEDFGAANPNDLSREQIIEKLLESGIWPFIRQRPYSVVANPDDMPKSIFISAFNSAPLAPDNDFILHGHGELFQLGLDAVAKLTEGAVHLNVHADLKSSGVFTNSKNAQINEISGPHPSGNVGVQIHHIDPLNKGEKIWYLDPQNVLTIGALFKNGTLDATRVLTLCGSETEKPKYFKTVWGACTKNILAENVNEGNNRIICGNVLTGTKISSEGYLGFYDDQITVIPEGDEPEFMGWLSPGFDKFSMSRTFFSWLMPNKSYALNTGMHGEERAFVLTGQYEKVFPMDIYPVHLLKAMIVEDVELMENLGIYEVAPEDFALCEYACTSKINVQQIVREGLDLVQTECG